MKTNTSNEQATPAAVSALKPAHTPTPWSVEPCSLHESRAFICASEGQVVVAEVELPAIIALHDQAEANAALIVRACNAWNDLAALKSRIAELEGASHA